MKSHTYRLAGLLPKLKTIEDEDQQRELALVASADAAATPLLVAGVLIGEDASEARLHAIVETLVGEELPAELDTALEIPLHDELMSAITARMDWGYRVGLVVGLRLATVLATSGGAR